MSDLYLKNIFDCVSELKNITISYRLWNLETIKENDINDIIIKELESYYKLDNLKEKLKLKNAFEINENIYINHQITASLVSLIIRGQEGVQLTMVINLNLVAIRCTMTHWNMTQTLAVN